MTTKEQIIMQAIQMNNPARLLQVLNFMQQLNSAEAVEQKSVRASRFKMVTVSEVLSPNYAYKPVNRSKVEGMWPGNESVEDILALRIK